MTFCNRLTTSGFEQTTNSARRTTCSHGNATTINAFTRLVANTFSLIRRRTLQLLWLLWRQVICISSLVSFVHSITWRIMCVMMMMVALERFVHFIRILIYSFLIHWHRIAMFWISFKHNSIGRSNYANISRTGSLNNRCRQILCTSNLRWCRRKEWTFIDAIRCIWKIRVGL